MGKIIDTKLMSHLIELLEQGIITSKDFQDKVQYMLNKHERNKLKEELSQQSIDEIISNLDLPKSGMYPKAIVLYFLNKETKLVNSINSVSKKSTKKPKMSAEYYIFSFGDRKLQISVDTSKYKIKKRLENWLQFEMEIEKEIDYVIKKKLNLKYLYDTDNFRYSWKSPIVYGNSFISIPVIYKLDETGDKEVDLIIRFSNKPGGFSLNDGQVFLDIKFSPQDLMKSEYKDKYLQFTEYFSFESGVIIKSATIDNVKEKIEKYFSDLKKITDFVSQMGNNPE